MILMKFSNEVLINICSFMDERTMYKANKSCARIRDCNITMHRIAQEKRNKCEQVVPDHLLSQCEESMFNTTSYRPWEDLLVNMFKLPNNISLRMKAEFKCVHNTENVLCSLWGKFKYTIVNSLWLEIENLIDLSHPIRRYGLKFARPMSFREMKILRPKFDDGTKGSIYIMLTQFYRSTINIIIDNGLKIEYVNLKLTHKVLKTCYSNYFLYVSTNANLIIFQIKESRIELNAVLIRAADIEYISCNGNKLYVYFTNGKLSIFVNNKHQRDIYLPSIMNYFEFLEPIFYKNYLIQPFLEVEQTHVYYRLDDSDCSTFQPLKINTNPTALQFFLMTNRHLMVEESINNCGEMDIELMKPDYDIEDIISNKAELKIDFKTNLSPRYIFYSENIFFVLNTTKFDPIIVTTFSNLAA